MQTKYRDCCIPAKTLQQILAELGNRRIEMFGIKSLFIIFTVKEGEREFVRTSITCITINNRFESGIER